MIDNHPQETLLIRYADGVTTQEEVKQIQRLLSRDPTAVEFLQQMAQTQLWLKQAADIPLEPTTAAVSDYVNEYTPISQEQAPSHPVQRPMQRSRLAFAATLLAGVVGGALLGMNLKSTANTNTVTDGQPDSNTPEWVRLVADYHSLYARETIGNSPTQLASEVSAELSIVLSRPVTVPELTDIGLEFKRVQTLVYDNQSLLQLAYLPDTARPVAICILAAEDAASEAIQSGLHGDMQYAYWQSEGHAVVIVGDLTQLQMDKVIAEVRRSLFSVG